ncbi:NAD(P)/FAD-dependent oxidoreductase [Lysinibacillus sp. G4S2]|uniref:NAD(P)/FAD-dependent oxidoreductase n=1 Tax=Lysinibacillus sp. G4S2 TaxID=3055859 RepID=UPI0025A2A6E3|nr:NAD(P)/FAD-dependent oxidoreductase [Lysinibacillus sp. G4S2]MDM5247711.1 NAD(P)/FAD-dependent oxidoreductase [Lysinibacillus sp. G4S2]
MQHIYDITIIGGGPAGLYGAFYSGLRGLKTKLIESQEKLGGKVLLYPEKLIWDIGGHPPVLGEQFVQQLIAQAKTFEPTILTGTKVDFIERQDDIFVLHSAQGDKHYSKTVLIAVGGGIINPQKLTLDGAEKYEMTNLHYTVQSYQRFVDKEIIISGGGNAAIDWAVELCPIAKNVTVVYRKDKLSAHEATIQEALDAGVQIEYNTAITKLTANADKTAIQLVTCENSQTKQSYTRQIDEVIVSHGYNREASLEFDQAITIPKKDDYYFEGKATGETAQPGIFAAGDILTFDGKIHLLLGTFQDAANAVNSIKTYLEPTAYRHGIVSSHNEVFKEKNRTIIEKHLLQVK